MLKGKSLVELAQAVQDAAARKVDVVTDTRNISLQVIDSKPVINVGGGGIGNDHQAMLTNHALNQITEHTGVPRAYSQRCLAEDPELLETNVNRWLHRKPSLRMIRTMLDSSKLVEGPRTARAFLSNRYQRIDFDQMLGHVLPELVSSGLEVLSTELTERKMYIKVVFPKMEGEITKGDVVQYGFELRGSEIGEGALDAMPFVNRLVCLNGLVLPKEVDDTRMRRAHLGRALEAGVDYYAEDTVRADDKAILLKLRDTIRAFQDQTRWQSVLTKLRAATQTGDAADPIATVERISELLVLPKPEQNSVLMNFLQGRDLTKWGLVNAVTAVANTSENYDRACELEDAGGRILSLPNSEWTRLAQAA